MGCCANFIIEENIRINQSILKKGKERQKEIEILKGELERLKKEKNEKIKKEEEEEEEEKLKKEEKEKLKENNII